MEVKYALENGKDYPCYVVNKLRIGSCGYVEKIIYN